MRDRWLVCDEAKILVSYTKERFENEPEEVQETRESFGILIDKLIKKRNAEERGEKSRNLQIAITNLEDACMRAVKALYL